jgi:hypothetical protein
MSPAPKTASAPVADKPAAPLKNVAASTPVKLPAETMAEDSHAAQAAQVGGAKDEAKIDLHALMTATDALQRDEAAQELANLVKVRCVRPRKKT